MSRNTKSVAVLGAGVAGLAAAKTFAQYGFEVTVYEARSELGGVWASNYRSLRVLEPKWVYGYPDWPWPRETPLYPPARSRAPLPERLRRAFRYSRTYPLAGAHRRSRSHRQPSLAYRC